jgi:hypothetical protein
MAADEKEALKFISSLSTTDQAAAIQFERMVGRLQSEKWNTSYILDRLSYEKTPEPKL